MNYVEEFMDTIENRSLSDGMVVRKGMEIIEKLQDKIELSKDIIISLINNPYEVTIEDIQKAREFVKEN